MTSTTNYQSGDLVLVAFPYTTGAQTKARPALDLLDAGDADVLVARVTTQPYGTTYDVPITHWQPAGLLAPSVVRLHKLATLEKTLLRRMLERLTAADRQRIGSVIRATCGAWR